MKRKAIISKLTPALALAALVSAQAAQAQSANCIEPDDLTDLITYAMPIAYDATMDTCADAYANDGFMRTGGVDMIERFRVRQDSAWPGAFRALSVFANQEGDGDAMTGMLAVLPEEQLRPFVDGIAQQMIGSEIKPEVCGDIEQGLELVAPLPVENISGLFTFVAERAGVDNPSVCGVEKPASTSKVPPPIQLSE